MVDFIIENWNKLELIYKILIILVGLLISGGIVNNHINNITKLLKSIVDFFKRIFKVKSNPQTTHKNDIVKNVTNHKMMSEMNELKMKFQSLNFGDNKRNRIFEIIMYTKINTTIKHLINFVKLNNIDELDKNEFSVLVFKMLQEMSKETNMKLKVELGEDVYNIVIDSKRGMKVWEKGNIESLLKYIKEVTSVDYINLNSDIFNLVQSSLSISLMVTFNSMEDRFFNFNGELTKVLLDTNWNK